MLRRATRNLVEKFKVDDVFVFDGSLRIMKRKEVNNLMRNITGLKEGDMPGENHYRLFHFHYAQQHQD
jgi:hypothetical protein